mgnify:CR=1 FL=1
MRILHISDTHGNFSPPQYYTYDCVIHSGDFLPNHSNNLKEEIKFQKEWLKNNYQYIKNIAGNKKFLFTLGNHDFINPDELENLLKSYGIDAVNLHNKVTTYNSFNIYGFPYVPYLRGNWNYERNHQDMLIEVNKMIDNIGDKYIHIFVCHSGLNGILDLNYSNDHIGSSIIRDALYYKLNNLPILYCHGHIHESQGVSFKDSMLISNASKNYNIIEI